MRALGAHGPTQTALPDTAILLFPAKQTAQKKRTGHFSPFSSPASLSLSLSISQQVVCSQLAMTRLRPPIRFLWNIHFSVFNNGRIVFVAVVVARDGSVCCVFCLPQVSALQQTSALHPPPQSGRKYSRNAVITGQLVAIPRMNQ